MKVRIRGVKQEDVTECIELLRTREPFFGAFMEESGILAQVRRVWNRLLLHPAVTHGVAEDLSAPAGKRIFNFGFVAFVRPEWLHSYWSSPSPVCGLQALHDLEASSHVALLTELDLKKQNSRPPGLVAMNLLTGSRPSQVYESVESVQAALAAYFHAIRGYRISEVVMEGAGAQERAVFLSSGSTKLRCIFENVAAGPRIEQDAPIVVGLSRAEANEPEHRSALSGQIFNYKAPQLGFNTAQQELLRLALESPSDAELLEALAGTGQKVKDDALGRRWDRIFKRVEREQPMENPILPAGCSPASKRSRLLIHLANNYQELRPCFASA